MYVDSPERLNDHTLFNEDCLSTTKRLPNSSIDLIYADPPFCSGRSYSRDDCSFDDRWADPQEYLDWMRPRLVEFKRVLKNTGSIYIHCDWHASHYLKVLADDIFGRKNFLNEIIWKRQSSHNDAAQGSKHFGRIHDSILIYTGSQNYIWNQQYSPYENTYIERTYKYIETVTERRYALGDLTGPGGAAKGNPMYEFLGIKRYWRYSKTKMFHLLSQGKIAHFEGKVPLLKRYLDEMRGKPIQDIWTDLSFDYKKNKRGFPTQKPEGLLERIIRTSTNPEQIVFESFAGSSPAGAACHSLSRKWIGSEVSETACIFSLKRLNEIGCDVEFHQKSDLPVKVKLESPSVTLVEETILCPC
jgi:adenine-specific DNA-methyltransferase